MRIPQLPEANHPLIESLRNQSDLELLRQFQEYPEQGKFFTAIVCRYTPIIYILIAQAIVTPEVSNYVLAIAWRQFFYEMRGLHFNSGLDCLQDWLIYQTGILLQEVTIPEVITYNLQKTPPALWCYVEQGLDTLPPLLRFILVTSERFNWNHTRIIAYLQSEGHLLSLAEITEYLEQGYQRLEWSLPEDIRLIYLEL
ncbi:sigma-70 family RNA polymerase sigma factor [Gloeocapsa sp. PCC 73106]|uniref:sigma-70 family RNA polymerase sigma factor n=1 Tax=Gloeocapsa sp. PCC 73106 TaxID=102232 RepID=UPI00156585A3|nr:sigma-70 family RNA polymerase sigma factor [Gloeocapsa sp. PCC 73106]